jgi:hypothetical protein
VLVRSRRLYDELVARKLVCAQQVFADKAPHQCSIHVKSEGMRAFVDVISTIGGLIAALRILRSQRGLRLRIAFHDLDRHLPVARVDKHPATCNPVHLPVCTWLFEPGQPPRSNEPVSDALSDTAILADGLRYAGNCGHSEKQRHSANRNQSFHLRHLVTRIAERYWR